MLRTLAIAGREIKALFYAPLGYIVLTIYLLFVGLLFSLQILRPGSLADPGPMIAMNHLIMVFLVPFITMALFSEEYRSGRIEVLRTSPLTEVELIFGKFLGALGFYTVLVLSSLVFVLILLAFGRPDFPPIFTGYVGLVLMGMLMVSVGLFFSALSQHQVVAAMSSCITLLVLDWLATVLSFLLRPYVKPSWHFLQGVLNVLGYIAIEPHTTGFARGVVDTRDVVYFLTGSFLFLALTYVVMESRRWR